MRRSRGETLFSITNGLVLLGIGFLSLYPFLYTFSMSVSTAAEANSGGLHLWPRHLSLAAYRIVLSSPDISTGLLNSVARTVLATGLTLIATCMAAYPLSRKELPHRGLFSFLIVFTMIFNGGIVPLYLLLKNLAMLDTIWSLVLPTALTAFNIILMKNFFQQIPESLAESARIDGASEIGILFRLYIPLSMPVLATVALWTAVAHWNAWFDAMLYITSDKHQVLQTFLQRIVVENSDKLLDAGITSADITQFTPDTIKAATVIVTVFPIMLVYPFLQRYFVKGITLGGVKE